MPSIWTYSDPSDKGYGLFKRRLLNELHNRGWETHLAEAPLLEDKSKKKLLQEYLDCPSDYVLLINQSASQFYEFLQIPTDRQNLHNSKIVWYLDNPQFFVAQPFQPDEYVFCFDETYLDWLKPYCQYPPGFLPLAADQTKLGQFDPKFACDISFVGGVIDQSQRRSQLQPQMVQYIQLLVEEKLKHRSKTMEELSILHPIAEGKQITINPEVAHYLYWEANNLYRLRTVEALQDFDLHLYGNEDWEAMIQGTTLEKCYKGKADPNTELPHIFVSSTINLNIHSIQCQGSLNQRDFNAPLCGGFLLSDWVPAAGRYFAPGTDAVYYSDWNHLRQKVEFYLSHEEERMQIVNAGKQKVEQCHTYKSRVDDMLNHLSI